MVSRRVWLAGLGTALVGPYLAYESKIPQLLQPGMASPSSFGEPSEPDWTTTSDFAAPLVPLHEVLRVDVTPDWVVSRWPRVATVVGDLEWSGMRVPLITGNNPSDFVGSLTYYFDGGQKLRRISLEGYAGDERPVVTLAMQQFGVLPEPSVSGGLYAYRWNREPITILAVQYAAVVQADSAQQRHIMLEVNIPSSGWRVSPQMRALLSQ